MAGVTLQPGSGTCWCCGERVEGMAATATGQLRFYECHNCDVQWRAVDLQQAKFTSPEWMATHGYVDHATVYAPSPA